MVKCVFCGFVPKHLSGSPEALAETQSGWLCSPCKKKIIAASCNIDSGQFTKFVVPMLKAHRIHAEASQLKRLLEVFEKGRKNAANHTITVRKEEANQYQIGYFDGMAELAKRWTDYLKWELDGVMLEEEAKASRAPPTSKDAGIRTEDSL